MSFATCRHADMKYPQEDIEEAQFASFREQISDFPNGEIVRVTGDIDFKITTPKGILGIEFTRIEGADFKQLSEANCICETAQELGLTASLPSRLVDVYFSRKELSRQRRQTLVHDLFRIVQEALNRDATRKHSLEAWRDKLPGEISAITIHEWSHITKPLWQPAGAAQVIEDCAADIQAAIDRKHAKLQRYRKSCDECWLVVVSDAWESSEFMPGNATLVSTFTSKFDRTYFMMFGFSQVWRLTTQKPA